MWKDIKWYEWLYQVSNEWLVKSLKFWKEIVLKWSISKCWHSYINLYLKWIRYATSNHREVAISFIENPDNFPCVLHRKEDLDENGMLYNGVDNLYWGTQKENMKDMFRKWRANIQNNYIFILKFWKDHHWSKSINQYTLSWEFIKTWDSIKDVERQLWIFNTNISACCSWKRKTAGWFVWKYK